MNFKIRLLITAAMMSSPVYGLELMNSDVISDREIAVSVEDQSPSFFAPKTMDDVREIASIKPDEMKVLNDSSEESH